MALLTLYQNVFIGSVVAVGLYPVYGYWRLYRLYAKAAGQIETGFIWFCWNMQLPHFGPGAKQFETLPQDVQVQVLAIRSRQRREILVLFAWIALLVLLGILLKNMSFS